MTSQQNCVFSELISFAQVTVRTAMKVRILANDDLSKCTIQFQGDPLSI